MKTPGEEVRNYYRKQGAEAELKRIVKQLEDERDNLGKAGLFVNGPELREQLLTIYVGLESALAVIKGENK